MKNIKMHSRSLVDIKLENTERSTQGYFIFQLLKDKNNFENFEYIIGLRQSSAHSYQSHFKNCQINLLSHVHIVCQQLKYSQAQDSDGSPACTNWLSDQTLTLTLWVIQIAPFPKYSSNRQTSSVLLIFLEKTHTSQTQELCFVEDATV